MAQEHVNILPAHGIWTPRIELSKDRRATDGQGIQGDSRAHCSRNKA